MKCAVEFRGRGPRTRLGRALLLGAMTGNAIVALWLLWEAIQLAREGALP